MPVVRYQIRNEYGLADPELYRAADREDPEALLEGVAMAGLVGVLRQLGDLAEFAAEIFHGLHEEVMATAARGHGLILRVQQLEAEFPAIEKDFLSQTSHSHLTCNAGIDWHPNLKVDQNVITQGDMPRFILDSYEECRGPPRLFVLDKFDIAGAGSCLKRYSDPSFFKMDLASSGTMEPEIQREKKARKVKRKGPRWKNGETPVTGTETHVNSMLQTVASDKLPDNIHVKRVKLKSRHLNDINASNERSYMARVLERHSPEHIVFCENSASHCHVKKSVDSSKSASEVHVVGIDASACNPTFRNRTPSGIPNTQEITVPYTNELDRHITKDGLKVLSQKPNGELESFPSDFQKADEKKWLAHTELRNKDCADSYRFEELEKIPVTFSDVDQKEPVSNAAMKTDGSTDGYISDDITSELDNYMDALATMESEVDTDTESRAKQGIDFVNIEHLGLDSDMNEEQQELQAHSLGRHSFENSSALVDHSIGQSSVSSETLSKDIAGLQLSQGNGSTYSVRTDLETDPSETTEIIDNITQIKNDISDVESSSPVVPKEICTLAVSDAPGLYEYKEASSSSTVTESNSTPFPFCPPIPGEVLSDTLYPNKVSSNFLESTEEIGRHLGSDLSPQAGPDEVQSAAVSINGVFSDNIESFEDYDKHSYDNSIHTDASCKSLSQTDADMLLPERVESSEILHHAIPNATDPNVTTSSIGISDDPIPVKPLPVEHVEELTADKLSNMADAPGKDTRLHDDAISENASIGNGADSIFLTVCKEELGRSMKQDPQPESGDCAEYIPVFPLENSCIDVQADGSLAAMENVVPPCESSECTVTIPENSGNIAKHEQHASDILPLGSQHFSDTDENHVDSAELLPSDSVRETIPDELSNASDHEVRDGLMPNGDLETSRCMTLKLDHFSQTTEYHLELPELLPSCSGEELPDILEARSNASDREEREEAMPIMRDHVDSAELLPLDFVRETIPDIPDVLSNASDHEVRDGLMPTGDLQTSRCMKLKLDHFSQTTEYHLESLEPSCSGQGLLDILETRSNASDREEREEDMPMRDRLNMPHDSSAANTGRVVLQAMLQEPHDVDSEELLPSCSENETTVEVLTNASDGQSRDLPMPVCDHDLHCSFMASNPPVDVDGHTPCRELISENPSTEDDSDEYISVKNCSREASDIPIHVQEECIFVDLVSDQHNLQINESSSTKDLLRLAVQTFPDITLSQENEDEVVLAPTDSKSGQQILNSLDNSGVGLVNHVYLTEPAQHAHVDMSPTNSDKDTTSLLESESHSNSKPSEENLFRCSNLQEECSSNDSTSDEHKLETTEASSQKDLTSFSDQGTPQVSVSDQEEVNAVFSPRDLKAEELVLGSPDHVGSEVLNCIGQTVSSEHAKLDLNPSIAKESTASPIEGEPYLASVQCHPYETASDISPFHSFHTEPPVPSEESSKLQAGRASSEITLQQMDRNLEHSDCQFASAQSFENSVTSNGCSPVDIVSQASEPDAHALVMDSQINSLEPESVLFQPSSELSISSLKSNFPPVSIATFPELSLPLRQPFEPSSDGPAFSFSPREGNALQSYVEEAPPLPPLPPLEWRMGKLQLGSMMSDGGMPESPNRHSPFMQLPAIDDSHGFARVEGEMMQPLNPFAEAPMLESKSHQHSYLTLEGESLHPLESSRTLPFFEDGRCKQGTISVDGKMGLPLPKSLIEESQIEDGKHLRGRGHGVFEKEMLPPSNPFAPVPASFIETFSSERDLLHPSNPFLIVSTMADEMFHYDYRDFRGENVQHLTTVGQVQFMDNVLPTTADEMPTRNPHSILNRPRDPLIEAVASHDKSTLRKVSELVRPSTKPKMDERETLLEQIRNKSFNLKPAVSAKPIIKGPSTNLKVAAILEKANAIRQAVGSDEDDDGDSWSDC